MEDGVWRTVRGRKIFIKEGQSLSDAMKNSGKFENESKKKSEKESKEKATAQKAQKIINEIASCKNMNDLLDVATSTIKEYNFDIYVAVMKDINDGSIPFRDVSLKTQRYIKESI
jgi:vacuolar-type H+-ATPase subunit I/STV1